MTEALDSKRDFFVSFNQADRDWATWIAWALEEKGYSVFFQDWDFKGNFILEMDRAHKLSRRTLAVLSPDYLASRFAAPEWAARFAEDATSAYDRLIPIRVRPCELKGLLAQIVHLDLVGCSEPEARKKILDRVAGIRLKPDEPPLFPGSPGHKAITDKPMMPDSRVRGMQIGGAPMIGSEKYLNDVFISYANEEHIRDFIKDICNPLRSVFYNALNGKREITVFSDGDHWSDTLKIHLLSSRTYVLVLTAEYFSHDLARKELCCILKKYSEIRLYTDDITFTNIFPLRLKDCAELPEPLNHIQYFDIDLKNVGIRPCERGAYIFHSPEIEKWAKNVMQRADNPPPFNEEWRSDSWICEAIREYYEKLRLDQNPKAKDTMLYGD